MVQVDGIHISKWLPAYHFVRIAVPSAAVLCGLSAVVVATLYSNEDWLLAGWCAVVSAYLYLLSQLFPRLNTARQFDAYVIAYFVPTYSVVCLAVLTQSNELVAGHAAFIVSTAISFASSICFVVALLLASLVTLGLATHAHQLGPHEYLLLLVIVPFVSTAMRIAMVHTRRAMALSHDTKTETARRLEQAIAKLRDEQALREESELQLLQVQKMEGLGLLAGGVAHDFNNFLMAITALADVINCRSETADVGADALEVKQIAMQASRICDQILTYAGRSDEERKWVSGAKLLDNVLSWLPKILPKNVELEAARLPCDGFVFVDLPAIEQMFLNLVTNAAEAMQPAGGQIRVHLSTMDVADDHSESGCLVVGEPIRSGLHVNLTVTDHGKGISQVDLPKIFDAYFTKTPGGHGLGLATVLGGVKSHAATLVVSSRHGRGTSMQLLIPAKAQPPLVDLPQHVNLPVVPRMVNVVPGSILVVDDEPAVLNSIKKMLSLSGWTVTAVSSALEAVEIVRPDKGNSFLAIVLDYSMPDMNGSQALVKLRELGCTIPVVLCSGNKSVSPIVDSDSSQPDVFLKKPYRLEQLQDAISRAIAVKDRGEKTTQRKMGKP